MNQSFTQKAENALNLIEILGWHIERLLFLRMTICIFQLKGTLVLEDIPIVQIRRGIFDLQNAIRTDSNLRTFGTLQKAVFSNQKIVLGKVRFKENSKGLCCIGFVKGSPLGRGVPLKC